MVSKFHNVAEGIVFYIFCARGVKNQICSLIKM
jgi:hypothetical protein